MGEGKKNWKKNSEGWMMFMCFLFFLQISYLKVKIDGMIPKGRFVEGPYEPIRRDCAMYFSVTVSFCFGGVFIIMLGTQLTDDSCSS